jgi:cobalt/nickel transport system ATP-binding protein
MENNCLLELKGVDFGYSPGRPVLQGAEFSLHAGERVALTGANGSGKTTLLHLLVGLLLPSAGEIRAFGRVCRRDADFYEVRCRVGLLFQDAEDQLFCPTVIEDVAFGPLNLGRTPEQARAVAEKTLEALGLAGYEQRITYKLSGGEKRLVSLATILAMEPAVLLLDEPTSGIDQETEERLAAILAGLPQAMIVVSHERDFLQQVTNRAVVLRDGKVKDRHG